MAGLLLEAVDVADEHHWRWLLTDRATGMPLADHEVALDRTALECRAFEDLYGFLRWYRDPAPDKRLASEGELLRRVGAWITGVLGGRVAQAIVDSRL